MKNKAINFWVEEDFHKQIKILAKQHGRTVSGLLRWLLLQEINKNEPIRLK